MKKEYSKPVLCIEYYMLSEAIAAGCDADMNVDATGACAFYANQADTTNCNSTEMPPIDQGSLRPPYTVMAPPWGPQTGCNCYNTNEDNPDGRIYFDS